MSPKLVLSLIACHWAVPSMYPIGCHHASPTPLVSLLFSQNISLTYFLLFTMISSHNYRQPGFSFPECHQRQALISATLVVIPSPVPVGQPHQWLTTVAHTYTFTIGFPDRPFPRPISHARYFSTVAHILLLPPNLVFAANGWIGDVSLWKVVLTHFRFHQSPADVSEIQEAPFRCFVKDEGPLDCQQETPPGCQPQSSGTAYPFE
jgi:hypothetical protein